MFTNGELVKNTTLQSARSVSLKELVDSGLIVLVVDAICERKCQLTAQICVCYFGACERATWLTHFLHVPRISESRRLTRLRRINYDLIRTNVLSDVY